MKRIILSFNLSIWAVCVCGNETNKTNKKNVTFFDDIQQQITLSLIYQYVLMKLSLVYQMFFFHFSIRLYSDSDRFMRKKHTHTHANIYNKFIFPLWLTNSSELYTFIHSFDWIRNKPMDFFF